MRPKNAEERQLFGFAKGFAYAWIWIILAFLLYRVAVPYLWGSRSDLGLFGAAAAAGLGLIGLMFLAFFMVRDVRRALNTGSPEPETARIGSDPSH